MVATPTPQQLRMARAALGWSLDELGRAAGLSAEAAGDAETDGAADAARAERIGAAYEAAGLVFLPEDAAGGPGVRLRAVRPSQPFLTPAELTTENDD